MSPKHVAAIMPTPVPRQTPENDEFFDLRVTFPRSTLPPKYRGTFLLATEHQILHELGEIPPFQTTLLLDCDCGPKEIVGNLRDWDENASTLCLKATGPHAHEIAMLLASRVIHVLGTTTFDQDGFVVNEPQIN